MRFVVIVQKRDALEQRAFGIYRSFKRAEGDARAWEDGQTETYVLPIENPDDRWN